ncbi:hypothetical protein [Alkalibacillus haloalkaliphilus]|uniref:DUF2157 domain-containing protein n=1 Tax=Alkalibacillus haloalkaliphilus TaxID=94136 RepID=A0A511W6A7_9BACI|nr:hypothetical protein [Alkalibacillus haloalkaliphilus]GEN46517.1 hypothetical protein AHA02nite_22930 [Alkalibacillus haloalkaliphilus]
MGNDNRNQVIIDEIKHWKQNKLLPAEYCDFLLALYTYGEGVEENTSSKGKKHQKSLFLYADVFLLILLLPISLYLLTMFDYNLWIEMVLFLGIIVIILGHLLWYKEKHKPLVHVPIILLFLVFLIGTISLIHTTLGQGLVLNTTILIHCIVWIIVGVVFKYHYLLASGIIGMILLLSIIFL